MEKYIKSIHEMLFICDTITIGNENCTIDAAMLVGDAERSIVEFQCKKGKNITYYTVDYLSKKIAGITQNQHAALRNLERILKERLKNANSSNRLIFKESFDEKDYLTAIQSVAECLSFDGKADFFVGDKKCTVLNYCVYVSRNGDGMIVYIGEDANTELIMGMSLYTQCSLEVELTNEVVKYNGNIVRLVALEEGALLYVQPYPMEIMQSTQMGYLTCEKGVNPFKLVDFLVNNADSDVNGLSYPGVDNKKIEEYLIVGVIRNIKINIEDLVIGTVRFGEGINTSDNFIKDYSQIMGDKTLVWVNVKEETLFKAFEKGKQLLNSACDFITLALKNDVFLDWYGTSEKEKTVWDIKSHTPNIFIDTLFLVENCSLGDAITFRDNNMLRPNSVQLDNNTGYLFEEDWIEQFFRKIHDSDEKILRLQHAIKWIVQAWQAKDRYDKLIYCSTALEFIVNGEKGYNIFNEYALKEKRKEFSRKEKNDIIADLVSKINIDNIDGISPEGIKALNESISNMVKGKLSEYSFNSKLDMLIKRLEIPVSEEEKQLLINARDARNKLIHGREMCYISTLEVKRLCGITSRVLIYKIIEKTKE